MATKIEWCDETINPIVGCTKISKGCKNCYAEIMATRLAGMKHSKEKYLQVITNGKWNGNVTFDETTFSKPKKWNNPKKIFITSMGDLFHENVPNSWLIDILFMVAANPKHTFIILTKRPERMLNFFTNHAINPFFELLPNLWLGITAEDQEQADKRIPILLKIPSIVHFVSCEPMLEGINLLPFLATQSGPNINWVIAGGENGNNYRTTSVIHFHNLLNQCIGMDIPFFFKGYGGRTNKYLLINNRKYQQFPKI